MGPATRDEQKALSMSSKLLHCLFQVLKMIEGDLNVEKWEFCANRQEDIS